MSNPPQKENSAQVGIVILNYNGHYVLPILLESLTELDYPTYKIYLVDNASTDDSIDDAERRWSDKLPLEIMRNESNLLFSAGNNRGIKKALNDGMDYVLLLNNDTIVPPTLVGELVGFLSKSDNAGIAGPMIHFGEPEGHIWGAGGMVSTWWGTVRHRGIREMDIGQFDSPEKVDYVSGAALMASAEVFRKLDMLDESFPMYYEDTDFCFRAKKHGWESWYVPTSPLIHLVSIAAGGQTSSFKIRRRFWAGMKFFARHAKWYQWPTIILGQIYEAFRVLILVKSGKTG